METATRIVSLYKSDELDSLGKMQRDPLENDYIAYRRNSSTIASRTRDALCVRATVELAQSDVPVDASCPKLASRFPMQNDADLEVRLLDVFAAEADAHLRHIEACMHALQGAENSDVASMRAILAILHTFKGAARTMEMRHLERLCFAFEKLFTAASRRALRLSAGHCALILEGVRLARTLTEVPPGRSAPLASNMIATLDALTDIFTDQIGGRVMQAA